MTSERIDKSHVFVVSFFCLGESKKKATALWIRAVEAGLAQPDKTGELKCITEGIEKYLEDRRLVHSNRYVC